MVCLVVPTRPRTHNEQNISQPTTNNPHTLPFFALCVLICCPYSTPASKHPQAIRSPRSSPAAVGTQPGRQHLGCCASLAEWRVFNSTGQSVLAAKYFGFTHGWSKDSLGVAVWAVGRISTAVGWAMHTLQCEREDYSMTVQSALRMTSTFPG